MQESCHSPVIRGMTGFLLESYPSFFRNLSFSFFSCNNLNHSDLLLELYMLYKKSIEIILIIV